MTDGQVYVKVKADDSISLGRNIGGSTIIGDVSVSYTIHFTLEQGFQHGQVGWKIPATGYTPAHDFSDCVVEGNLAATAANLKAELTTNPYASAYANFIVGQLGCGVPA